MGAVALQTWCESGDPAVQRSLTDRAWVGAERRDQSRKTHKAGGGPGPASDRGAHRVAFKPNLWTGPAERRQMPILGASSWPWKLMDSVAYRWHDACLVAARGAGWTMSIGRMGRVSQCDCRIGRAAALVVVRMKERRHEVGVAAQIPVADVIRRLPAAQTLLDSGHRRRHNALIIPDRPRATTSEAGSVGPRRQGLGRLRTGATSRC
jgi:hypothetical protein